MASSSKLFIGILIYALLVPMFCNVLTAGSTMLHELIVVKVFLNRVRKYSSEGLNQDFLVS